MPGTARKAIRSFDLRRYDYYDSYIRKDAAQVTAGILREQGAQVRITETSSGWDIWVKWKE